MDNKINDFLGLIGIDVNKSLSSYIHNSVYQKRNQRAFYKAYSLNEKEALQVIKTLSVFSFKGINITNPYKELAFNNVDILSKSANEIGAINTIKVMKNNILKGYNTDFLAVKEILKERYDDQNLPQVLLLGAGGAAKAVFYALINLGFKKLTISNRTRLKAENLVSDFNSQIQDQSKIKVIEWDKDFIIKTLKNSEIIIDTTGLSWSNKSFPGYDNIISDNFIFDLSYPNFNSKLKNKAKEVNADYIDGKKMLLYQAREADKIWFPEFDEKERKKLFELKFN